MRLYVLDAPLLQTYRRSAATLQLELSSTAVYFTRRKYFTKSASHREGFTRKELIAEPRFAELHQPNS